MKKAIILSIVALTLSLIAQGQNNQLKFNQVKIVQSAETVPAGKVWKVESVIYNITYDDDGFPTSLSSSCNPARFRYYAVTIDGTQTKVGNGASEGLYNTSSAVWQSVNRTMLPLWLPAGSSLDGGPCNNKISVIEYNVVPE